MISHLTRIFVLLAFAAWAHGSQKQSPSEPLQRRVPKQIHTKAAVVETEEDHNPAESHFGAEAAHHGHGKYFMDTIMIQSGPKQLEFGHVCENPHEWEQRYERQDQDKKRYQGKARWGDKHGGYGEHYWDYNHGGHHGDEEASEDEGGDETHPVPDYQQLRDGQDERVKREHEGRRPSDSSENLDYSQETLNSPRTSGSTISPLDHQGLSLAYDVESGTVVDEATGRRFMLTPIN
ncbi:uncharacterized protein LOC128985034 [Macrosteles quadrilineatus]|uniref:uncharacterized protein LOC128985034 n=1 Tax=Macrosteles quadrilineatus TaxID=74068 RepID=UPI0023E21288|nr:uncharacterized protein LOC128985034 [Macrosteles quadrilineatus]